MNGLIYAPLRIEQRALRRSIDLAVGHCGRRAQAAVAAGPPVLLAGVAGGLAENVRPGDVVVADEVRLDRRSWTCPAAPMLAGALRRAGLAVHVGPIESAEHVVDDPQARGRLAASGSLAIDTESAYVAQQVPSGRLAVIRVVVDTADHPLWRPGTLHRGTQALKILGDVAPIAQDWALACSPREVLVASPRSFCAGVDRAIQIVERALRVHGTPVYVRRQIVHNSHVVADLEAKGAVFVRELDEVPRGALVVLAAHGVAPSVRAQAAERDLQVIDATCPLVAKVHHEVQRYAGHGSTVFLIGHRDHEEVIGTLGEAPDRVVVVESPQDAETVEAPDPEHVSYVMQTTLAVADAERSAAVLRRRFPALSGPRTEDICYATTNRQQAVTQVARHSDLVLVVGSANSSNSRRLAEVAEAAGTPAHLVEDLGAVDPGWLRGIRRVGLTAGASAPTALVDELIDGLAALGDIRVTQSRVTDEDVHFALPREVG